MENSSQSVSEAVLELTTLSLNPTTRKCCRGCGPDCPRARGPPKSLIGYTLVVEFHESHSTEGFVRVSHVPLNGRLRAEGFVRVVYSGDPDCDGIVFDADYELPLIPSDVHALLSAVFQGDDGGREMFYPRMPSRLKAKVYVHSNTTGDMRLLFEGMLAPANEAALWQARTLEQVHGNVPLLHFVGAYVSNVTDECYHLDRELHHLSQDAHLAFSVYYDDSYPHCQLSVIDVRTDRFFNTTSRFLDGACTREIIALGMRMDIGARVNQISALEHEY